MATVTMTTHSAASVRVIYTVAAGDDLPVMKMQGVGDGSVVDCNEDGSNVLAGPEAVH